MSEGDDELDIVENQACDYLYDHAALSACFRLGSYGIEAVRTQLTEKLAILEASFGKGTRVLSTFPGMEGFEVDVIAAVGVVVEDMETFYTERQPYAIGCGVYLSLLERFQGNEALVLVQVDQAIEHYSEVLTGKVGDNGATESLRNVGVSVEMYLEGLKKVREELNVLIQILQNCRKTIPQVERLLQQREVLLERASSVLLE